MNWTYRNGMATDVEKLKQLAVDAWSPFKEELTEENWLSLFTLISNSNTFTNLIYQSQSLVCETADKEIIGMAFLVPHGNPTEIYDASWCYIRFVSVHPSYGGNGIGTKLTEKCITLAIKNREQTIALHTSEMMNAARHIYEQLGFKVLREIDERLGKKYWLYTLDLNKYKIKHQRNSI